MIVLDHESRIVGMTLSNARLTDEHLRIHVPTYGAGVDPTFNTKLFRLCHIVAPSKAPQQAYEVAAVILGPNDDPSVLPGWQPWTQRP